MILFLLTYLPVGSGPLCAKLVIKILTSLRRLDGGSRREVHRAGSNSLWTGFDLLQTGVNLLISRTEGAQPLAKQKKGLMRTYATAPGSPSSND